VGGTAAQGGETWRALAELSRVPPAESLPEVLEWVEREANGLGLASRPVLLWRDQAGGEHAGVCAPSVTRVEVALADAVALAASKRPQCGCGGVALTQPLQLLYLLQRLRQVRAGELPEVADWAQLAALVGALRPVLEGASTYGWLGADVAQWVEGLTCAARGALWASVLASAERLPVQELERIVAVPAVTVPVTPDEGELLSRWARYSRLGQAPGPFDGPWRTGEAVFARFEQEAREQLEQADHTVLVDLGEGADGDPVTYLLTRAPVEVALLVACGRAEVVAGRLWGHVPELSAAGLVHSLRLAPGRVAADVSCAAILETLSQLLRVLTDPPPLEDLVLLARRAL
jgi:hypothetical protein